MEQIKYRKTLDVHKNGIQFVLQGFETADNLSRVIEISLMASGDAIDFPLEQMEVLMYVTTPSATQPSINKCTIKDNKVIYNVLPIVEEGITEMQLKLIETHPEGARSVLASPKFSVEVTKSNVNDEGAQQTTTFTALEDAVAKAKGTYDERLLKVEVDEQCIFRAYYADGTVYETDAIKECLMIGHTLLSKSYAVGDTGAREDEATDNSKYYSNVSRSSAIESRSDGDHATDLLTEVRKHGVYTSFGMDFNSGELLYSSPSYKFSVDTESGDLKADGKDYSFEEILRGMVAEDIADEVAQIVTENIAEGKTSEAPYASDLSASFPKPILVRWDSLTAFTPYASGLTTYSEGFAIVHGTFTGNHTIVAWATGEDKDNYFIHTVNGGTAKGWNGYLHKSGGTLSGSLGVGGGKGTLSANDEYTILEANKDADNSRQIRVANPTTEGIPLSDAVKFSEIIDGVKTDYKLFGEHNMAALASLMGNVRVETGLFMGIGYDELKKLLDANKMPSIEFKNISPFLVIIFEEGYRNVGGDSRLECGVYYFLRGQGTGFGRRDDTDIYFVQEFGENTLSWRGWKYNADGGRGELSLSIHNTHYYLASAASRYRYIGIGIGGENE